ncbi:MAG TPA: choice-of-anchor D domain-containing protein, partial [Acidimicrobiales bacterium]|nr:choice-of-anchor D domain-containing protein [Acidimicrobiales bacterium]
MASTGTAQAAPAATPLPVIISFKSSTQTIPYKGGTATITAKLGYGVTCELVASKPLKGLPYKTACKSAFSHAVTIPETSSQVPIDLTFGLEVTNKTGTTDSNPDIVITQGALPPPISFTPYPFVFKGAQAVNVATTPAPITVHNNSKKYAQALTGISVGGTDPDEFNAAPGADGCNVSTPLPPGGSCTIQLTFLPLLNGTQTATLEVYDASWGTGTTVDVPLSGTGVFALDSLSSATLAWPVYGVDVEGKTLTEVISNPAAAGGATLYIDPIYTWTIHGNNATDWQVLNSGGTCNGATVDPGASCSFNVLFDPTGSLKRSAKLSVPANTQGGQILVQLQGTGAYATGTFDHLLCSGNSCTTTPWATQNNLPFYNFGSSGGGQIIIQITNTS